MDLIQNEDYAADSCAIISMAFLLVADDMITLGVLCHTPFELAFITNYSDTLPLYYTTEVLQ